MKKIQLFILLLSLSIWSSAQLRLENYALEGLTLIDANHKESLSDQTVLIRENKIFRIFETGKEKIDDSITVFKMHGKFLIPGLMDTHVHLKTNRSDRSSTENRLKEMLMHGITNVRDMANDVRTLSSIAKDALVGDILSPDIYYASVMAGKAFFSDPRTAESSIGGINGEMPYMRAIDESTDFSLVVAEAKGTGATGIKLYEQLDVNLINKVIAEAKKQDIKVWGHSAMFPAKPSEVVNAGVSVISHAEMLYFERFLTKKSIPEEWKKKENPESSSEYWDMEIKKLGLDTLLESMKTKGTILDATLTIYSTMIKKDPKSRWRGEISTRITKLAYEKGVKVCTGTDSDDFFVNEELKILVKYCSFKEIDAIIAGTINSAEAIGIEKTHGTIEEGKIADLVILNGNPLENIRNIDEIHMVIKDGIIHKKN